MFISPCHDTANSILHDWFESELVPKAVHWIQYLIFCEDARGSIVYPVLDEQQPAGLCEHGHGSSLTILGHQSYTVWAGYGEGLLYLPFIQGKILYAMSCHAGADLGQMMVDEYGASGFLGFNDLMYIVANQPFKETSMEPWIALMEGQTMGEAYQRTLDLYDDWIDQYPSQYLIHNRDHFIMYGDTEATLLSGQKIIDDTAEIQIQVE